MVSGAESQRDRWNSFVEKSAAGSVHAAEMPFANADTTGSLSGAGFSRARHRHGVVPRQGAPPTTFPTNIASTALTSRAASSRSRRLRRQSLQRRLGLRAHQLAAEAALGRRIEDGVRRAGISSGKEIEIAAAFYAKQDKKAAPGVPVMLAALVTNDKADILATAYAPAEPDYAKASPFETLLRNENPNQGRFIPPLAKGDHAWMSQPLPPSVFSKAEQKCLANAIYFEARSESLRGQAAVAQVVLNRVRNPAYPNSICGVVYQNDNWRNRCQFSFACDGIKDRVAQPLPLPCCRRHRHGGDGRQDLHSRGRLRPRIITRPMSVRAGRAPCRR